MMHGFIERPRGRMTMDGGLAFIKVEGPVA